MTIIFKPNGSLDISTDPSDLPQTVDKYTIQSGAMTRCKNLRIDQNGVAKTRDGSNDLNSTETTSMSLVSIQNGIRYAFGENDIYKNESSIDSSVSRGQWSAIQYNAFNDTTQCIFALNGTDRKRIEGDNVYEWGIDAPIVTPETMLGTGDLTGDYSFKYTYARQDGDTVECESNPSSASDTETAATQAPWLKISGDHADSQITDIRVYRTIAGGTTYNYDSSFSAPSREAYGYSQGWEADEISDDSWKFTVAYGYTYSWEPTFGTSDYAYYGTHTGDPIVYISVTADSSLGSAVVTNNDRPPLGTVVTGPNYNGICFILKDNNLYYCKNQQPEYWPSTYYVEISPRQFPCKAVTFHNGQPYVLTEIEIYYIQGTGHGTFFPIPMRAKTGAKNQFCAVSIHGDGIYHVGDDGIYLFSGEDVKLSEATLTPLFRGETVSGMPGISSTEKSWLFVNDNNLYFGYTSEGYTYPTNCLMLNLDTKKVAYYNWNNAEIRMVAKDKFNNRLIAAGHDGYARQIENKDAPDDSGTDIAYEVQSKDFTLQTRAHFPRWVKYDIDASSATTCTGELLLDGSSIQNHTLSGNRSTKRRLVAQDNGERCALKVSGTGKVSIYAIESE